MDTARQQGFWHPTLACALNTLGATVILAGAALVFQFDARIGLPLIAAGAALFLLAKKSPLSMRRETHGIILPNRADIPLTTMTQIPDSWPGSASRFLTFAIVAASQRPILSRFESDTGLILTDLYGDKEEDSKIISTWLDWIAVNFFNANSCIYTKR